MLNAHLWAEVKVQLVQVGRQGAEDLIHRRADLFW